MIICIISIYIEDKRIDIENIDQMKNYSDE